MSDISEHKPQIAFISHLSDCCKNLMRRYIGKAFRIMPGKHSVKLSYCWCHCHYKVNVNATKGSPVKVMVWWEQQVFKPISDELEVSMKGNGSSGVICYFKAPLQILDIKVLTFRCNLNGYKKKMIFSQACQCWEKNTQQWGRCVMSEIANENTANIWPSIVGSCKYSRK